MTANVTLKGNGRAQRTTLHVLGQSQEKVERVLVAGGDIHGLKQPVFLIFPTTLL